jgi:2-methylaconitate cis-trans-isomerase PrpF
MQQKLRCVVMRGGTSRALFFHDEDLPRDPGARTSTILAAFGSPDPYGRQINGLGGATSTTSKVAIIRRSDRPGIDVEYTFGQVAIDRPLIDGRGNCGNISSAVGPYAIDEGLVAATGAVTQVRILNTNTDKVIVAHVPTKDGCFAETGDFEIDGIPGTGSRILLDYVDPGGSVTGTLLPTGRTRDVLQVRGVGAIEVSIVDAANPLVFCRFGDLGMSGDERPEDIDSDPALLARIESVRAHAGVLASLAKDPDEVSASLPSVPKLAFVAAPKGYRKLNGSEVALDQIDLVAKIMSMGKVHRAYALTGAICTTLAALIPGTLVNDVVSQQSRRSGKVRLGHPSGIITLEGKVTRRDGTWVAETVSATRTARRLMEGFVLVPRLEASRELKAGESCR